MEKNSIEILHADADSSQIADSKIFLVTDRVTVLEILSFKYLRDSRTIEKTGNRKSIRWQDTSQEWWESAQSLETVSISRTLHRYEAEGDRNFCSRVAPVGHLRDRLVILFLCAYVALRFRSVSRPDNYISNEITQSLQSFPAIIQQRRCNINWGFYHSDPIVYQCGIEDRLDVPLPGPIDQRRLATARDRWRGDMDSLPASVRTIIRRHGWLPSYGILRQQKNSVNLGCTYHDQLDLYNIRQFGCLALRI